MKYYTEKEFEILLAAFNAKDKSLIEKSTSLVLSGEVATVEVIKHIINLKLYIMHKGKLRYTLVRAYWENALIGRKLKTEEIHYSTLKEAVEWATVLSKEEASMSYIFDNVRNKKLTLKGN